MQQSVYKLIMFTLWTGLFFAFLLALPGVGIGVWPQSELLNAMILILVGLMALGMTIYPPTSLRRTTWVLSSPLFLLPLGLAMGSILVLPFMPLPVRHLLGSPQSTEGIALWLAITTMIASSMIITGRKSNRPLLVGLMATGTVTVTSLYLLQNGHWSDPAAWLPYQFSDFLGWIFLGTLVALMVITERYTWWIKAALILGMMALQFIFDNKAAQLWALTLVPLWILVYGFKDHAWGPVRARGIWCGLFAVGGAALLGVIFVLPSLTSDGGWYGFDYQSWMPLISTLSRTYLIQNGLAPILDNPARILTGAGWGTYTEQAITYLPMQWVNIMAEGWAQWDGVTWDHFHTHHIFIETFISTGIFGLVVLILFWLGPVLWARPRHVGPAMILTSGGVIMGSLWFIFPVAWPFLAMAFGLVARPSARLYTFIRLWALHVWRPLWMIISLILLITGGLALHTGASYHQFDRQEILNPDLASCDRYVGDHGAGGLHLARLMMGYTRQAVANHTASEKTTDLAKELPRLHDLFCQGLAYRSHERWVSMRLYHAILATRGEVMITLKDDLSVAQINMYTQGWDQDLIDWLVRAPGRTDMAVPYLNFYLAAGDDTRVAHMASQIYRRDPLDPVGLWFTGVVMLKYPDQAQAGLARMRAALDAGIERFMPVDKGLKGMLNTKH